MITEMKILKVKAMANVLEGNGVPKGVLQPLRSWADKQQEKLTGKKPETTKPATVKNEKPDSGTEPGKTTASESKSEAKSQKTTSREDKN